MKRFKFFVLELELPSRKHHSLSLARVSIDDLYFAEIPPHLFDEAVEMDRSGPLALPEDDATAGVS